MHSPHLRDGELLSISLRERYLHKLCGILLLLISSFIMSEWTHGYLFYILYHYLILCYLFCYPYCSTLAFGTNVCSCVSLTHWNQFLFLSTSLLSGTMKCSKLIQYIFCPISRISHFSKNPGSFCWRVVLEMKVWVLGVLVAPGGHSQWAELGNIHMYTSLYIQISVIISTSFH